MPNKQQDKEKVLALADGEECYINWFSESGAKVVRNGNLYSLYEVSCAGKDWYYQSYAFDYIDALIDHAYTWS
jgi:hypothetical protein